MAFRSITFPDLERRRAQRPLRILGYALLLVIAISASMGLSYALVSGWLVYALAALLGLVWVVVVVDRPEIGIATLLFLTSGFVSQDSLPAIHLGGNFRPTDLILIFLMLLIVTKPVVKAGFDFIHTPLDLPMLAWTGAAIIACVTATRSGVTVLGAIPEARNVLYYLAFFAVTNLVRDEETLKWLVKALFLLAFVTSFLLIAQAAVGSSIHIIPGFVYDVNVGSQDFTGVSRVEAPGSILIQCLAVAALVTWMLRRVPIPLHIYAAMLGVILVAAILPFYRSLWISFIFSLGIAFALISRSRKARILLAGLVAVPVAILLFLAAISAGGKIAAYANAFVARGGSVTTGSAFTNNQDTWADRLQEVVDGIPVVEAHPVFGVGYLVQWRSAGRFVGDNGTFTHNGYLWILVKMGLLGFIPFLLLMSSFVVGNFRRWRDVRHPFYQALALGLTLAISSLLISNIAEPRFVENWTWTTAIAVLMGVTQVIFRLYGRTETHAWDTGVPVE